MKKVKMLMSFDDIPGEDFQLSGEFSEEDVNALNTYRSHVASLRATRVIKDSYPARIDMVWTNENGVQVKTEQMDDELVSSFLHTLRPLILTGEPASFDRTSG